MKRYLMLAVSMSVLGLASAHAQTFPSTSFDNSARITQTGNGNDAAIDQAVGGAINGQNTAEIVQTNDNNYAAITQTSATSPFAAGFANTALIDQRGARGEATIDQIHDYLVQRDNRATIVQITPDATATIQQRGDRNTASISQLNGSVDPLATIEQNGRINVATVRQTGANGVVEVLQGTFVAGPGASPETLDSRAIVDTEGSDANIFVSQIDISHDATVYEDGSNGLIIVDMAGTSNFVNVLQESANGVVDIISTGTSFSNIADVIQNASDDGSTARVMQTGSYAESAIEQLDGLAGGGGNLADVTQTGIGTGTASIYSTILQNGGTNTALVLQASSFAQSDIAQSGVGHMANVSQ